ncbi:MAG: PIG-L family deacetylase [Chloroflexi bacterium]|uniref:PIG-L deacetylase family protein n=1 Tax=Candidatus Flexifilum breve TaxID=3140694 RepID=UPI00313510FC|nr:PIG-L family deacetylase [Chloroflexota bacterium]
MELEKPIVAPFKILGIVAHPDDTQCGSAGSVGRVDFGRRGGDHCIVTDGAVAGSNDKDVVYNQLVERRQAEQLEAAEIVGVKEVVFLSYPDGALTPSMELRRDLTRLIRRLRPDRVLIMDPTQGDAPGEGFDYINHPDHRATGEASLYAIFLGETRPIFPNCSTRA